LPALGAGALGLAGRPGGAFGLPALAPSRFTLRRCGRDRGSEDSTSLPSEPFDMNA
jgi:hypothetical protein